MTHVDGEAVTRPWGDLRMAIRNADDIFNADPSASVIEIHEGDTWFDPHSKRKWKPTGAVLRMRRGEHWEIVTQ